MALLRLKSHRRHRPSFEPRQRNGIARDFAITIFAFVEAADRGIDLRYQLALTIAGAELDAPVRFARRAVGEVRLAERVDLKLRHGLARFFDDRFLPVLQFPKEVGAMQVAHELVVLARAIALGKDDAI